MTQKPLIADRYQKEAAATLFAGDRLQLLAQIPDREARLIVTSPPYNIGKTYERRIAFEGHLEQHTTTIRESFRVLANNGSLCWQVGNQIGSAADLFPSRR